MKDIKGKNALLTGGSRGLGPYIALALAGEGVNLALTARSEEGLRSTANNINKLNIRTEIYPADITDHSSRMKLVENVKADLGSIDLLINNAGMEWVSSYAALSTEDIQTMIQTNLVAPMVLTRLVLPHMIERDCGHVVTMSSLGGKKGSPYSSTYAATKAGLIQWTHALRSELRETGVSASVVCPGFVSEAGMFAVYNKRAPKILGESTPEKVATAVVRAIEKNVSETVVNPGPVWPMMIMESIHPDLVGWVLRKFGVYEFYREQAQDNEKISSTDK